MNVAEALARLDSELGELLDLGKLVARNDRSTVQLRAFMRQLDRLATTMQELESLGYLDHAQLPLRAFVRRFTFRRRAWSSLRMLEARDLRSLMYYARSLRAELVTYQVQHSADPVVPISTGKAAVSSTEFTAVDRVAESVNKQGGDAPAASVSSPSEQRYLIAKSPSIVGARTKFTVKARIDIQATEGASAPLEPMSIPESGLLICLHAVLVGDGLELDGTESHVIRIFSSTPSDEVIFQFKALKKGPAKISLRAYVDQAFRGELELELEVANKGVPEQQETTAQIGTRRPPPRHATLEIEYQPDNNAYRYLLRGPSNIGTHKYFKQLTLPPKTFVADLMAQINEVARNHRALFSDVSIETMLKGIGSDLWDQLLPTDLQAKLVLHWDDIDRLELLCDEEPLPWELLYCHDQDAFMADQWLVFRWMYGAPAPFEVGKGPARYVMASPPLPNAQMEIQAARAIYPSNEIWTTVQQLILGLKKADMGLLHFAAHNLIRYSNAGASAVQLDGPYNQSMLSGQKKASLGNHPLVFLNACSSAAAAEQLVGCASWAGRFLSAGAGAFIGSMWEIRDLSAYGFSDAFYRQTQKGSSLGEAFRIARDTLGVGDPTRFAYTLFGDPDATLYVKEH